MAIRLIVTINAAPGKGSELTPLYKARAQRYERAGCEQFEVFQSVVNPDKLTILERWIRPGSLGGTREIERHSSTLPPELRGQRRA